MLPVFFFKTFLAVHSLFFFHLFHSSLFRLFSCLQNASDIDVISPFCFSLVFGSLGAIYHLSEDAINPRHSFGVVYFFQCSTLSSLSVFISHNLCSGFTGQCHEVVLVEKTRESRAAMDSFFLALDRVAILLLDGKTFASSPCYNCAPLG